MAGVGDGKKDTRSSGAMVDDVTGANQKPASAPEHGVDCIADEVVEDLPNFALHANDGEARSFAAFQSDAGVGETRLMEGKHGTK